MAKFSRWLLAPALICISFMPIGQPREAARALVEREFHDSLVERVRAKHHWMAKDLSRILDAMTFSFEESERIREKLAEAGDTQARETLWADFALATDLGRYAARILLEAAPKLSCSPDEAIALLSRVFPGPSADEVFGAVLARARLNPAEMRRALDLALTKEARQSAARLALDLLERGA